MVNASATDTLILGTRMLPQSISMAIVLIMAKTTDGTDIESGEMAVLYTNFRGRAVGCVYEWSVAARFVHGTTDFIGSR